MRRLADAVAIAEIHAEASPEEKLAIVRAETARARTVYIGDGVNDAPALLAATVGIAFGQHSDVTSEAARVVIIDSSLSKVDELMHVSYRLRRVALQSAIGGMVLSVLGMGFAAAGLLGPVAGAVAQEAIDVAAVLNALRTARSPRCLTDFDAIELVDPRGSRAGQPPARDTNDDGRGDEQRDDRRRVLPRDHDALLGVSDVRRRYLEGVTAPGAAAFRDGFPAAASRGETGVHRLDLRADAIDRRRRAAARPTAPSARVSTRASMCSTTVSARARSASRSSCVKQPAG